MSDSLRTKAIIPDIIRATFPESLQDICNSTKPGGIGDIHAAASSDGPRVFNPDIHAELDDACHASMAERQPCQVLVVVAGSNAAVVGATLTAFLARDCGIDELHVVAPVHTGDELRAKLLRSPNGSEPLADLCRRLGILRGDMLFGNRTIHLMDSSGGPLAFGPVADDVLQLFRSLCVGDNELTVVAAPDAGPLGLLAYAALPFVGRPKDRFYFLDIDGDRAGDAGPAARSGAHRHRDRRPPAAPGQRAALAEIPIVLAARQLEPGETFQRLAESRRLARQRLLEPGTLFLHGKRRTVRIDETELTLPRLQFFWFFALASLAPHAFPLKALTGNFHIDVHGRVTITAPQYERVLLEGLVAGIKKIFLLLFPDTADEFPRMLKQACGPSPGLPSVVAKVNARLKQTLGLGATPYLIAGGRSAEGYRLTLPTSHIKTEPHLALVLPRS